MLDYDKWLGVISKQLEIKYGLELDMFKDLYDFQEAFKAGRATRLVVEDLYLIIE